MTAEPRTIRHEFRSDAAIDATSLYARARQARAEAIGAAAAIFDDLRALAGRIARRRRDARARRELAALSNRSLADIGLNRLDVHREDLSALARERTRPANRNDAGPRESGLDARQPAAAVTRRTLPRSSGSRGSPAPSINTGRGLFSMTIFSDRQKAFEQRFKHEQDLGFRITARRNRLFGEWAAGRLDLSGADADEYAKSVVQAQFAEPGVVAKIDSDLQASGVAATETELRAELARFAREARRQIADLGTHHARGTA